MGSVVYGSPQRLQAVSLNSVHRCICQGCKVGEGVAEAPHGIKTIFNVNALGWNIYFLIQTLTSVERHRPVHKFTCLACEIFELEALGVVQSFPVSQMY